MTVTGPIRIDSTDRDFRHLPAQACRGRAEPRRDEERLHVANLPEGVAVEVIGVSVRDQDCIEHPDRPRIGRWAVAAKRTQAIAEQRIRE